MANVITTIRVMLAFGILFILKINAVFNLAAIVFVVVVMVLDAVDGAVARYLKTVTFNGSVYDILADRIIENIFIMYFVAMSLIDIWVALIILTRGLIIDAVRSLFIPQGKTAFGDKTLHSKKWTKFIACSKMSRGLYNCLKMLTFICFVAIAYPQGYAYYFVSYKFMLLLANLFLLLTVILSLLRALPVLFDGWIMLKLSNKQCIVLK